MNNAFTILKITYFILFNGMLYLVLIFNNEININIDFMIKYLKFKYVIIKIFFFNNYY